ncbi:MAG: peptide deformylase [Pseudomonadota bacterium]
MTIREILIVPHKKLRLVSDPVDRVDDDVRLLLDDMLETMYDAKGIGLAAIQIGVPKRVIVMDLARDEEEPAPRFFVNPEIYDQSEDTAPYQEGCLSIPEFYEEVERPATCRVRYLDYDGTERDEAASDLFSVCIQHEMDHLNGVLFLDHISRLKRDRILKKIKKDQRLSASA